MPDMLKELARCLSESFSVIEKAKTYCTAFSLEVLKQRTEHFQKIDVHFDADGLVAIYKCNIDSRTYTVKVTPSKP
jgi:hypothetical protein